MADNVSLHRLGPGKGQLVHGFANLGQQLTFYWKAITGIPHAVRHFRHEIHRLIAEVGLGTGTVVLAGGTLGIVVAAAAFVGTEIGLEGYTGLDMLGLSPIAGFVSAFGNTREMVPIIAGAAFAAQVGTRFTAQIGSMRISEEIDALEVMAIPSMPYLISTRLVAAFFTILPLYLAALFASYVATELVVVTFFGQSPGTYEHYFQAFISPRDIVLSATKALTFAMLISCIHCYYGFTASGGPEGVGRAAGRAIRASIMVIAVADMLMSLAFYGGNQSIPLSG